MSVDVNKPAKRSSNNNYFKNCSGYSHSIYRLEGIKMNYKGFYTDLFIALASSLWDIIVLAETN